MVNHLQLALNLLIEQLSFFNSVHPHKDYSTIIKFVICLSTELWRCFHLFLSPACHYYLLNLHLRFLEVKVKALNFWAELDSPTTAYLVKDFYHERLLYPVIKSHLDCPSFVL